MCLFSDFWAELTCLESLLPGKAFLRVSLPYLLRFLSPGPPCQRLGRSLETHRKYYSSVDSRGKQVLTLMRGHKSKSIGWGTGLGSCLLVVAIVFIPVSVKETLLLGEPLPCNPATAFQPLIWQGSSSLEDAFFHRHRYGRGSPQRGPGALEGPMHGHREETMQALMWYWCLWKNTPFTPAFTLQSGSRNRSPAPDLVCWKLFSPHVPGGVFISQTPVWLNAAVAQCQCPSNQIRATEDVTATAVLGGTRCAELGGGWST